MKNRQSIDLVAIEAESGHVSSLRAGLDAGDVPPQPATPTTGAESPVGTVWTRTFAASGKPGKPV